MAFARLTIQETVQIPVPTPCDLCDSEEEVNSYCRNCAQKLCDVCKKSHLRITATRDHIIVHISEGPCLDDEPTICDEHKHTLTFYCRTCDSLSCPKCLAKHHNGHNFIDTDEYAKEVSTTLSSLISNKEKEREKKVGDLQTIEKAKDSYMKEMGETKRKIKEITKGMADQIRDIEIQLISEVNQEESEGLAIFEHERKVAANEESHLQESIEKLKSNHGKKDNISLIRSASRLQKEEAYKGREMSLLVPVANLLEGNQPVDLRKAVGVLQITENDYGTKRAFKKPIKKGHVFKDKTKIKKRYICPYCGSLNDLGACFCEWCRYEL